MASKKSWVSDPIGKILLQERYPSHFFELIPKNFYTLYCIIWRSFSIVVCYESR